MRIFSETMQATLLFIYVLLSSAIIIGVVRHISDTFHTFQVVLCYNLFALVCFAPWLLKHKLNNVRTARTKMYWLRAFLEFGSFSLSFYALTLIPLPMHTALLFVTPIFGTIVAILVLKERPTAYTYVCVAAGFIGVLVITRPGIQTFSLGIILALMAAIGFAFCGTVIKMLTRTERSSLIAFYMLLMSTAISAPFGLYHWVMPSAEQWGWLALIGALGYSQQIAVAHALSKVPYTTVIPLNFAQLVFVSIIAYFVFNELIDAWTLAGATLIIAGTLFNAYMSTRRPAPAKASIEAEAA